MSRFTQGDRIEMTEVAVKSGLDGRKKRRTGVFVRYFSTRHEFEDGLIIVKRDGEKVNSIWSRWFWKKVDE